MDRRPRPRRCAPLAAAIALALAGLALADGFDGNRRPVPREHPRLLGSREDLRKLKEARPEAYRRMAAVAAAADGDAWARIVSLSIVAAVEGDAGAARKAVDLARKDFEAPVLIGHVPFGTALARCAIAYDLAFEAWTPAERDAFHRYLDATVDGNRESEPHVFHNGWYGYKHWGIGLAAYACWHEHPRAREMLAALEDDYLRRAAPAQELAGAGGGWAEGYYIHYWLYEWLFFCEAARRVEGVDYHAPAPSFYRSRALAGALEMYPGLGEYGSRRPIPMGDGGGRVFGGDRDKALAARWILESRYRDDPVHRSLAAFDGATPRTSVGDYAYKAFLWRDPSIPAGSVGDLPLSHHSAGAGFVYARSSWSDDAVHFFFHCGDRFTAHQHLDAGHFLISKGGDELAGDGGHYDDFGSPHDVNVHLRTIAHSTVLVLDPDERWPAMRAGKVESNDGGQAHPWPHHNGAVADPEAWKAGKALYDLADVTAFEERGSHLHVAGDLGRAYSPGKVESFRRQVVFLRPGTFVVLDRVVSRDPSFRKTWLLQAAKVPEAREGRLVVTSGRARLFVETLLPREASVRLVSGDDLYRLDGRDYPPRRSTGPAPECRIEVSPPRPSREDLFLHVLTAADASVDEVPRGSVGIDGEEVIVEIAGKKIRFSGDRAEVGAR